MSPACRSLGCDVCFVDVDGLMPTKAMMDDGWIGWMTAVVCGGLWLFVGEMAHKCYH